jgi:predicted TIM-barrel fold metal-dependent hydrolase
MIDVHNHIGVEMLNYLRGEFPYCQHLETMVTEGGKLGIDKWVVFPMVTNLSLDFGKLREGTIESNPQYETVPYAWENLRMMREIYDLFPDCGAKTFPFVFADPMRNVEGQVAAIRELKDKYRFYGIKFQTTIIQAPIKSLLGVGLPLLELAEEWDLPVLIHSSVDPADLWAQARDILEVVEQHPGIRFCLAHSCRFDRECLDRVADLPNAWFDCSAHCIHCDLAVQDSPVVATSERRIDSDFSDPRRVFHDLASMYPEALMWGSDSPYYSYVAHYAKGFLSLRSTYEKEVSCVSGLPTELGDKVTRANALRFLGVTS